MDDQPGYHCECDQGDVLHPDGLTCIPNAACSGEADRFQCNCTCGYQDLTTGSGLNCTGM